LVAEYLHGDYLCDWVEISHVGYFDEEVEYLFVVVVVDADDVAASGFDLHGVADYFLLCLGAAEHYAGCAFFNECYGAVFELASTEAFCVDIAYLFDLEGRF